MSFAPIAKRENTTASLLSQFVMLPTKDNNPKAYELTQILQIFPSRYKSITTSL